MSTCHVQNEWKCGGTACVNSWGSKIKCSQAPTERCVSPAKWVLVESLAAFMGSFRIFMKCQHGMDVEGNDQV